MKTKYKKNEVLTAVLFLAPSVLLWLFWFLYPALKSMRLSFYDYSFINPERQKFVGLDNYIRLFQDSAFLDALKHTFILAFVVVAFISVLAFIIAVLLEGNIRGKTFFRTVCFMPYIISSVAVSIFFMYFFVKGGLGTRLFMLFGAEGPGLSKKALEMADDVVYISQFGSVRSLNAGAAAAVSMHAWIAQHAAPNC